MSKDMLEKLQAFLESPEGVIAMDEFGEKMKRESELKEAQCLRVESMFVDQESFDFLMQKICDMHNKKYEDACYKKGYVPYPNNVLSAMINVIEKHGSDVESLDTLTEKFPSEIVEYMGWQIGYTHGQGTCISVYKNKELIIRL